MNQQMFAAIFASMISSYFGILILMYVARTFLACVLSDLNHRFIATSSSKAEVGIITRVAIPAVLAK